VKRDIEHLNLLSLFHYIRAGILALFVTLFGGYYVVIGVVLLVMPPPTAPPGSAGGPPPEFLSVVGWLIVAIGAGALLLGYTMTVLTIIAGRCLARHRHWTFCFIVACVQCAEMPMGTVLGIFTILVLLRPSVKELFEGKVHFHDPEEDEEVIRTALPVDEPDHARGDDRDDRIYAPRRDNP
jgi:hypothetical protein